MEAILGLIARHLLTGVGSVLIAKGIADEATVSSLIGAVSTLGGIAWSVWHKYQVGTLGNK